MQSSRKTSPKKRKATLTKPVVENQSKRRRAAVPEEGGGQVSDSTANEPWPFHSNIFFGDLNYRLDLPRLEVCAPPRRLNSIEFNITPIYRSCDFIFVTLCYTLSLYPSRLCHRSIYFEPSTAATQIHVPPPPLHPHQLITYSTIQLYLLPPEDS